MIGYCLCMKPYRLELLGLFITIGGIVFLINDTKAERVDGKKGEFQVYAICMLMSFMAAVFFIINGVLVKVVPIFTLLEMQNLVVCLFMPIVMILTMEDYSWFSLDIFNGGFGFMNPDEAFYAFVYFGLSAGFFGNVGYVICLLFFSPVITSAAYLIEIFIGQLIAFFMGIDKLPGWLTWMGTVCVLFGVLFL